MTIIAVARDKEGEVYMVADQLVGESVMQITNVSKLVRVETQHFGELVYGVAGDAYSFDRDEFYHILQQYGLNRRRLIEFMQALLPHHTDISVLVGNAQMQCSLHTMYDRGEPHIYFSCSANAGYVGCIGGMNYVVLSNPANQVSGAFDFETFKERFAYYRASCGFDIPCDSIKLM